MCISMSPPPGLLVGKLLSLSAKKALSLERNEKLDTPAAAGAPSLIENSDERSGEGWRRTCSNRGEIGAAPWG